MPRPSLRPSLRSSLRPIPRPKPKPSYIILESECEVDDLFCTKPTERFTVQVLQITISCKIFLLKSSELLAQVKLQKFKYLKFKTKKI